MKKNIKFGLSPELSDHDKKIIEKASQAQQKLVSQIKETFYSDLPIDQRTMRKFTADDMLRLSAEKSLPIAQEWIYNLTDLIDKPRHAIPDERYKIIILSKMVGILDAYQKHNFVTKGTLNSAPFEVEFKDSLLYPDPLWYRWHKCRIEHSVEDEFANLLFLLLDYSGMLHLDFGEVYQRYTKKVLHYSNFDEALYCITRDLTSDYLCDDGMVYTAISEALKILKKSNIDPFVFLAMRIRNYMMDAYYTNKISYIKPEKI